ncbi:MAG: SLC13 family permease [Candidatus Omnitrophota bacterium]|nr:SLC13 family permease [Candidatus Omnitrophota bacterium]
MVCYHNGMKNAFWYAAGIAALVFASSFLGLSSRQLMAVAGFSSIFFGAIFFWQYRLAFAFLGVAFLLTTGLLDVPHVVEFASLDIILFLISMMIIVGFLEEKQFFEHLVNKLITLVGMHGRKLLVLMLVASSVSAALVDEVTSVLFMAAAMLNIVSRYKLNPVPFIIMVVFATNIGSSATVVGNPVGVIIALRSGLGFMDFIRWAAPISFITLIAAIMLLFIYYRKDIDRLHLAMDKHKKDISTGILMPEKAATPKSVHISGAIFAFVILGLVFHVQIEHFFGLAKNTMLLGMAMIGAAIVLLIGKNEARNIVEKRVDWWTLCFFLFLFASVGTLKYQGITTVLAEKIIQTAGNNIPLLMGICVWTSGALTSVMDNVLAVATFVPIIKDIGAMGVNVFPLWWSVLFGSTLLGNLTIIGSTANIVAVGVMEKRKAGQVGFLEWLKVGIVVAIPTLLIAHLLLLAQLRWMPK